MINGVVEMRLIAGKRRQEILEGAAAKLSQEDQVKISLMADRLVELVKATSLGRSGRKAVPFSRANALEVLGAIGIELVKSR